MAAFTFPGAAQFAVELIEVGDQRAALFEAERALVEHAVEKRQCEFASGRVAAHRVMSRLGLEIAPVLADGRAPRWPEGHLGSIAHTNQWAMATLAARATTAGVGLDIERHDRMRAEMLHLVLTPAELEADADPAHGLVKFSAKETVYKAVNPLVGTYIGFREVEIDLRGDSFRARYVGSKSGLTVMNDGVGVIAQHAGFVATLFWLPPGLR